MNSYYFSSSSSFTSVNGRSQSKSVMYENKNGSEKGIISETKNGKTVETVFDGKNTKSQMKSLLQGKKLAQAKKSALITDI